MTFKTEINTDVDVFVNFDEFAKTVTYTAVGQSGSNIYAVVERNAIFQEPYVRGMLTALANIYVKKSDVSNPQFGDVFEFDGEVWELDPSRGVFYEDDNLYHIGLERRMG